MNCNVTGFRYLSVLSSKTVALDAPFGRAYNENMIFDTGGKDMKEGVKINHKILRNLSIIKDKIAIVAPNVFYKR